MQRISKCRLGVHARKAALLDKTSTKNCFKLNFWAGCGGKEKMKKKREINWMEDTPELVNII